MTRREMGNELLQEVEIGEKNRTSQITQYSFTVPHTGGEILRNKEETFNTF